MSSRVSCIPKNYVMTNRLCVLCLDDDSLIFCIFRALLLRDLLNLNKILLMSFLTFIFPKISNRVYLTFR